MRRSPARRALVETSDATPLAIGPRRREGAFDRKRRMVSYTQGFAVSRCLLELLSVELERAVRNIVAARGNICEKRHVECESCPPRYWRARGCTSIGEEDCLTGFVTSITQYEGLGKEERASHRNCN